MKAVAADALRLMRLRVRVYLGGAIAGLVVELPLLLSHRMAGFSGHSLSGSALAGWGIILLLVPGVYLAVFRDSLMTLRGTPKPWPGGFVRRYLRFLGKSILLGLMALGVALLVIIGLELSFLLTGQGVSPSVLDMEISVTAVTVAVVGYLSMRWGMALPAAAAGDPASIRLSWRMTRGHGLRLFLFALPYLVLVGLSVVVNVSAMREGSYDPFSPAYLLYMAVGTVAFWFTFAAFAIWYERLRMRYEQTRPLEQAGGSRKAPLSGKIPVVAVAGQAVALGWKRKWTFLGLLLVGTVPAALVVVATAAQPESGAMIFLTFCVYFLSTLFWVTTSNHLAMTMQRGAAAVFPKPFWPALGRVFVRGLILTVLSLAVLIVFMIPFGVLLYLYLPQNGGTSGTPLLLFLLFLLAAAGYVLVVALMLRLGIMVPAATVGVVVRVREALAMTRGHSWRMFWSMVLVALPAFILGMLFEAFVTFSVLGGQVNAFLVIPALLLLSLSLFTWTVMLVLTSVWYEKLRLRAAGNGSGPAFEFESAAAAAGPADLGAGPGVGPYADLPEDR